MVIFLTFQAAEYDVAVDHSARYSSQYERMLIEYSEYLEAAKNKLPTEPGIAASSIDDLRHKLSSNNVSKTNVTRVNKVL